MPLQRRLHILSLLGDTTSGALITRRLCQAAAEVTHTTAAGVMLIDDDGSLGSLCSSGLLSDLSEQAQYELGEGPSFDAHRDGVTVSEPNLAGPAIPRWAAFAERAKAAGVQAVFGFPLRVGAVRYGALGLYNNTPGRLTDDQHANALVMADITAEAVLLFQAKATPGTVASALTSNADFHYIVHQAAGMVAVQLAIPVGQALIRLRSFASESGRTLDDLAVDVVNRTVRLRPDDEATDTTG